MRSVLKSLLFASGLTLLLAIEIRLVAPFVRINPIRAMSHFCEPYVFEDVEPGRVTLVNGAGGPLASDDFCAASTIELDSESLGHSHWVYERRVTDLLSGTNGILSLPVDGSNQLIAGWRTVQLPNGDYFVAGGKLVSECPELRLNSTLTHTWLINPKTKAIVVGPKLTASRQQHGMTQLRDGRVLISGGFGEWGSLDSCEIFDPLTNTMTTSCSMTVPRACHSTCQLSDGRVLIVGGFASSILSTESDTAEAVDSNMESSKIIGRLHRERHDADIVAVGAGSALVVGGMRWDPAKGSSAPAEAVRTAELFSGL